MSEITIPAILSGAVSALVATVVFLFYRIEKLYQERDKMHEAHKQELRDNGKALVQISKDLFTALERVNDLAERFRQ